MGGQIRRGRIWRFLGAPIFSPEVPKYLFLNGFGASGRKIGAPRKRQIQPRRIWPPICGPLRVVLPRGRSRNCLRAQKRGRGVRGHVGAWGAILLFSPTVQAGLGGGEEGHAQEHTGTYTRMLHLPFSDLPLKKSPILVQEWKSSWTESFWVGYPADVWADIRADVPTQKLPPHRSERRKIMFFARTSLTRRRVRPWPEGLRRALFRKISGWFFVTY